MKMNKVNIIFIALTALLFSSYARTIEPSNYRTIEPARIISLKPNITEILFALGIGDKVIGVTTWCDYPEEVKNLPKVADYININTEKIIALKPDLVIGSEENSVKKQFAVLQNAGIKTLTVPFKSMKDLYSSIEKIAEVVGKKENGAKLSHSMQISIQNTKIRKHQNTKILILVGHHPLVAAGPKTFLGDILNLAGAKNIIDTEITPYPTINTEFILAKNPNTIIDLTMGTESSIDLPEILKKRVVKFDMSDFRAGPRIGEAVNKIAASL
ncbi:MAG: ABC transporter substrate-binding protein [Deltaproteobacteria bacterium]|nr:ABC transporter substrate-binding protein [Deltaproteobacteria bacterium]